MYENKLLYVILYLKQKIFMLSFDEDEYFHRFEIKKITFYSELCILSSWKDEL